MRSVFPYVALAALAAPAMSLAADNPYQGMIDKGREFLFRTLPNEGRFGYSALGTMALLKTSAVDKRGIYQKDARIKPFMDKIKATVSGDFLQHLNGHEANYELGVVISALIADDPIENSKLYGPLVAELVKRQNENGSFDYPNTKSGDTSVTQIVMLALWEAQLVGQTVPLKTWDMCLWWHITRQDTEGQGGPGGFAYKPSDPPGDVPGPQNETGTMGAGGLSSALIAQSMIPNLAKAKKKVKHKDEEMLIPYVEEEKGEKTYEPRVKYAEADRCITAAEGWVTRNFGLGPRTQFPVGSRTTYYLYTLERCAAIRKGDKFQAIGWYEAAGRTLGASQKSDGSWSGDWAGVGDTSFAILALGKVMATKLEKIDIQQLGRSTMIGGKGLPTGDGSAGSALSRMRDRYKQQATTSVDDLIAVLDNPDAIDIPEEQVAQVEDLKPEQLQQLVAKIGGDTKKLRNWAYDRRPAARAAALAALAKTKDYRVVPLLIEGLESKEDDVYRTACDGLRYLCRNQQVFDLPEPSKRTASAVAESVRQAKEWFAKVNVQVSAYQEFAPVPKGN